MLFRSVAGGPAGLAGVQAHPVGAAVLEDDDEAHLGSAGGVVGEAVEVAVGQEGRGYQCRSDPDPVSRNLAYRLALASLL